VVEKTMVTESHVQDQSRLIQGGQLSHKNVPNEANSQDMGEQMKYAGDKSALLEDKNNETKRATLEVLRMKRKRRSQSKGSGQAQYPIHFRKEKKLKKQFWTTEEVDALLEGVTRHGVGSWIAIKTDEDFAEILGNRTTVDVKDKWRNYLRDIKRSGKQVPEFLNAAIMEAEGRRARRSSSANGVSQSESTGNLKAQSHTATLKPTLTSIQGSAIYESDFLASTTSNQSFSSGKLNMLGQASSLIEADARATNAEDEIEEEVSTKMIKLQLLNASRFKEELGKTEEKELSQMVNITLDSQTSDLRNFLFEEWFTAGVRDKTDYNFYFDSKLLKDDDILVEKGVTDRCTIYVDARRD